MDRPDIFKAFAAKSTNVNDGFAFRTDAELERAYLYWVKAGSPAGAYIRMDSLKADRSEVIITVKGVEVARG